MADNKHSDIENDLRVSFHQFFENFTKANEAGLDTGGIISGELRSSFGEEAWANLPLSVKMMLG